MSNRTNKRRMRIFVSTVLEMYKQEPWNGDIEMVKSFLIDNDPRFIHLNK